MLKACHPEKIQTVDFSDLVAFSRLRRYPGFSSQDLVAILRADLLSWLNQNGQCLLLDKNDTPVALACLYPLTWDSHHFSMPMYRLQLFCSQHATTEECRKLAQAILADARISTGHHVSVEIDIDNYSALNALTSLGFEILDLRRTYCTNRMREDIDFVRMRSRVRHYESRDYEAVMQLAHDTEFPSRFSRDTTLPTEKVRALYETWFHQLVTTPNTNAVVYERGGNVIACGAIGETDYRYAGLHQRLRTGSLYAGRADSVGAYTPVLYQLIMEALDSHGLVDTTVSMNNVTVCRVIEGFRSYKSAAAAYSLRLYMK